MHPVIRVRSMKVVVTFHFPEAESVFLLPPREHTVYPPLEDADVTVSESPRYGRHYYFGYALSFISAALMACSFVINQILDDFSSVYQLNFGKFLCLLGVTICYMMMRRQKPHTVTKSNILYLALFTTSTLLDTVFGFAAVTHIAVGTGYAIEAICFLALVILIRLLQALCRRTHLDPVSVCVDIITVLIVCVGVLFIVQPIAIFHDIDYFNKKDQVYTSLCNAHRFQTNSSNGTSDTTTLYIQSSWQGYLYATLAGLCCALKVISGHKLLEMESLSNILFWTSFINSCICFLVTALTSGFTFPSITFCFIILIVHAVTTGVQTFLFYIGLSYISSTDVAIAAGFVLPLLFMCQFTFLSTLSPTPTNAVAGLTAFIVLVAIVGKPVLQGFLVYKGYIE